MRTFISTSISLIAAIMISCISLQVFAQGGIWLNNSRANSLISSDSIFTIAFDNSNNVWLATRYGADNFNGTTWTSYNDHVHITNTDIWDIENAGGTMYFGTRAALSAFDGSAWNTYTTTNSGLINTPVVALKADLQGNLWIGTARGMNRLSPNHTWTSLTVTNTPAFPYNGIQAIATDAASNVWIAFISTAGIVEFPMGNTAAAKRFRQDTIPNFPKSDYISCLSVDNGGNLWAGTTKNGAVRINASGATVFSTKTTSAIKCNNVHNITNDKCGNVWISTDTGAYMFDGISWTGFSKSAGYLQSDTIYTVEVDGPGHIWFGTKKGLTEFKPLPQKASLIYPPMQAIVRIDSITCKWAWACPGILKYWYEIADNPVFTNSRIDTTSPSLMQSASKWDTLLVDNTTYYWRIKAKNDAGWGPFTNTWTFTVNIPPSGVTAATDANYWLREIYPNPTDTKISLDYSLARNGQTSLTIIDELGVTKATPVNEFRNVGVYHSEFNCLALPTGAYYVRLEQGDIVRTRKFVVTH